MLGMLIWLAKWTGTVKGLTVDRLMAKLCGQLEIGIMRGGIASVAFCRNDAQSAFLRNLSPNRPAAISLIGDDRERQLHPAQKGVHQLAVMPIPARYGQTQGGDRWLTTHLQPVRVAPLVTN